MAAILSYVLSIQWFLPLEGSQEQFLLGSRCSRAPRKPQDQEVLGKPGPQGLGAKQPVCVQKLKHTHTPQPKGNQSNLHGGNCTQKMSFPLDFLLFLSCFGFFFHYAITKRNAYRYGKILWIVYNGWSEWWHWVIRTSKMTPGVQCTAGTTPLQGAHGIE